MACSSIINFLIICCLYLRLVSAATNITTTKFLRDSETLVSSNEVFKLGFFSPINSTNRYVGIWFSAEEFDTKEVVWVANRNNPINDSSGVLQISEDGNLQLSDKQNRTIWSSNVSDHNANSTSVAQLLDTGNLILVSNASGKIIWQSFKHMTDSLLQQTTITIDPSLGRGMDGNPVLRSWKSPSNPSNGLFELVLIPSKDAEFFVIKDGEIYWRSGPWNGSHFLGVPYIASDVFRIAYDQKEHILNATLLALDDESSQFYLKLYDDGNLDSRFNDGGGWVSEWQSIASECDVYSKCGPFGRCNSNDSPICNCLDGFEPKNYDEWSKGNWTDGCIRTTQLQCGVTGGTEDGFSRLKHVKVPVFHSLESLADETSCRRKCLESCSCLAYAYENGLGCLIWNNGNLEDIQVYSADGVDLFIRLAHSELLVPSNAPPNKNGENNLKIIIIVTSAIAAVVFVAFTYCLWSWIHRRHGKKSTNNETTVDSNVNNVAEFHDLPLYKLQELEDATNNFSDMNLLGRGGFGPVYKGKLENGQEIAVKRLSRASGQGLQEFMNEVLVISKLQHKNLVKLLGCCVEREEKLLVYECMPNKSLDALLFDLHHKNQLDWKKRFNIISGICRGLLYLHRDSRLKIIHRDLKASNILLDEDFNPKISDFGMARIFENNQDQANTLRVVGTYGYMSPEYAMEGRFSEKSDVFSLGVLLLEIISGRKNSSFLNNESLSLLTYAWKLWTENDMIPLIDPNIYDPSYEAEILKCIQLGLLCVQEFPQDRPTISNLILMLDNNDVMDLPRPTQPGFTHRKMYSTDEILQSSQEYGSVNHVSLTAFSGR